MKLFRKYDDNSFGKIIEEYFNSGVSGKFIARKYDIPASTFYDRLRKYKTEKVLTDKFLLHKLQNINKEDFKKINNIQNLPLNTSIIFDMYYGKQNNNEDPIKDLEINKDLAISNIKKINKNLKFKKSIEKTLIDYNIKKKNLNNIQQFNQSLKTTNTPDPLNNKTPKNQTDLDDPHNNKTSKNNKTPKNQNDLDDLKITKNKSNYQNDNTHENKTDQDNTSDYQEKQEIKKNKVKHEQKDNMFDHLLNNQNTKEDYTKKKHKKKHYVPTEKINDILKMYGI